jgi:4-aminobutyrate aminotransferase-like enzyme
MSKSNCNVRFVSSKLTECAEAILATLPSQLDTILFCNSGSEANDLAMRLARDYTGNEDIIVLDHAYHGHLISTMQISPYKFDHGSTISKPEWVHVVGSKYISSKYHSFRLQLQIRIEENIVFPMKNYTIQLPVRITVYYTRMKFLN